MNQFFRKNLTSLIIALLILAPSSAFSAADSIIIDGVPAEIPADMGRIQEKDDRTFVPIRFISEFLNNAVWYDDAVKTATIESEKSLIFIQNGNCVLNIISKEKGTSDVITMDTVAFIDPSEGRTYIPIRYLAESLDYTVGWDEKTQTVTLDKANF